jgi:hypothetical protein
MVLVSCSLILERRDHYAFDFAKTAELTIQVTFIGLVTKTSDDHGPESIASNVGIFVWFDCDERISQFVLMREG